MAGFIVRVELHNGEAVYNQLHIAMEGQGFSRTIKADGGPTFHLPTAEYYIKGSYQINQILNSAIKAANSTGKKHSIIVTETAPHIVWDGLKQV